jgi:copper chaperone CopZ
MFKAIRRRIAAPLLALALSAFTIGGISGIAVSATPVPERSPRKTASVPAPKPGEKKVLLKNLGMACPFCKAAISAKLKGVPGVIAYEVDLRSDSATVLYDPAKVTIEKLKEEIAETGFRVRAVEELEK